MLATQSIIRPSDAEGAPAPAFRASLSSDDGRHRRRNRSRAATVDAAFSLFAKRGFSQVSVGDICEVAEISQRTFFRYFDGKDDVLSEPAREMAELATQAIHAADPETSDVAVLRHALTLNAEYVLADPERFRELGRGLAGEHRLKPSPFTRLFDQEARIAQQLTDRRGVGATPDWRTRTTVACLIAAFRVWLDELINVAQPPDVAHLHEIFDFACTAITGSAHQSHKDAPRRRDH